MSEFPTTNLRKADFWTSTALLAAAAGMLLESFTMPLEGTYAGVQNAWYVSPALLPLIVAACLAILSIILLINAVRTGGARAALHDLRHPQLARFWAGSEEFWIVGAILFAYIYILIPSVDFIAATALLLFALVTAFDLDSVRAARRVLALFAATVVIIGFFAFSGIGFAPRSAEAYWQDAFVWAAVVLSIGVAIHAVQAEPKSRARLVRCIGVSILTPLILGPVFKYGLLVPLPNEGITIEIFERIRYGAPGILSI